MGAERLAREAADHAVELAEENRLHERVGDGAVAKERREIRNGVERAISLFFIQEAARQEHQVPPKGTPKLERFQALACGSMRSGEFRRAR